MTDLERLRIRLEKNARKPSHGAEPWLPPKIADFVWDVSVLAFDQTLSNCGWLIFSIVAGYVVVLNRGTLRPKGGESSFFGTWQKSAQLRPQLKEIIDLYPRVDRIVCEHPSVAGGYRTESSLMAGSLVYELTGGEAIAISARHASKVLCGESSHNKQKIRDAVARYIPGSETRQWNEHQRDAAALGLTDLYDLKNGKR